STSVMPLSIAVTGDYRHYAVPELSQVPTSQVGKDTSAIAIDAFVPVLPRNDDKKGHSLALNGEFVTGYGMADLYTGLTGGMTNVTLPNRLGVQNAPTYPQDFDNGLVTFDNNGGLHGIQWTTYLIGIQYYLPGMDGRLWLSANYSHTQSANTNDFT